MSTSIRAATISLLLLVAACSTKKDRPSGIAHPTAVGPGGTAPVASARSSATLTLVEIVRSEVDFEDLTPDVRPDPEPASGPTRIALIFELGPGGLELRAGFEKSDSRWQDHPTGLNTNAHWTLEDTRTGGVHAEGDFTLPNLCDCAVGRDHRVGDVLIHHAATFRLDVPRVEPHERIRISSATGEVLGVFSLERETH